MLSYMFMFMCGCVNCYCLGFVVFPLFRCCLCVATVCLCVYVSFPDACCVCGYVVVCCCVVFCELCS